VYKELHFPALSRRTRAEYTTCANRALAELPAMVTPRALLAWRNALLLEHDFGAAYVRLHVHVLHTVATRAEPLTGDRELRALVLALEQWRLNEQWVHPPPADFLVRVLPAARSQGERAWLLLAGLAGLRKSELLGLKPEDFNQSTAVLAVERQRHEDHRKNHFAHHVHVTDPELRVALYWTLTHRAALVPSFGNFAGKSDGYVFPWAEKYLEGFLARIRATLGADAAVYLPAGCGWHHWRRWGAATLAAAGASVWQILDWLGDRDPSMASHYVDAGRGCADTLLLDRTAVLAVQPASTALNPSSSARSGGQSRAEGANNQECSSEKPKPKHPRRPRRAA